MSSIKSIQPNMVQTPSDDHSSSLDWDSSTFDADEETLRIQRLLKSVSLNCVHVITNKKIRIDFNPGVGTQFKNSFVIRFDLLRSNEDRRYVDHGLFFHAVDDQAVYLQRYFKQHGAGIVAALRMEAMMQFRGTIHFKPIILLGDARVTWLNNNVHQTPLLMGYYPAYIPTNIDFPS